MLLNSYVKLYSRNRMTTKQQNFHLISTFLVSVFFLEEKEEN